MRRIIGSLFAAVVMVVASAHIGSPNVLFDGMAGPYVVRVMVTPPDVVPGLAEVMVRADSTVTGVAIRPVFWRAGAKGAPSADPMTRVAGKENVYTGRLWLMAAGAYGVYVTVNGPRGAGTVLVPVNSFATGRLELTAALGGVLVVLGIVLFAGLINLIRAGSGESLVPAGAEFDAAKRRRANIAGAIAVPVLALVVFGGFKWWRSADAGYRRNMYGAPAADPTLSVSVNTRRLQLRVHDTASFHALFSPAAPDHGKMMHLFLISDDRRLFAHLHPVQTDSLVFGTSVPWLPTGRYRLFGDIMLENGTSLTVTNTVDLPAVAGTVAPSDSDDSWVDDPHSVALARGAAVPLGDGLTLAWAGETSILSGRATDLKFTVEDSLGRPAQLEPYLGMAAHAVLLRDDRSVFIHLHPMGTVSTAAQEAFMLRDRGDTTAGGRLRAGALDSAGAMPMMMTMSSDVDIPYVFPKPGRYTLWVQVKAAGKVRTGMFDVAVH